MLAAQRQSRNRWFCRRYGYTSHQAFGCGYAQGVMAVNPNATVIAICWNIASAWNDPVKGSELQKPKLARRRCGLAAAGSTGVGVLQTVPMKAFYL